MTNQTLSNASSMTAGRPSKRTEGHVQGSIDAMRETIRLNIDVDKTKHSQFKIRAIQEKKTMAAIMNDLIDQYLKDKHDLH